MTAKLEKEKRKSFLDVLKQNFNLHERTIFVHRLIYFGKFVCEQPISQDKTTIEAFQRSIKLINERYFDEKLSGFLLLYDQYFSHVIEGSEESIIRFLTLMYENSDLKDKLGTVKLLAVCHHINQRLIDDWKILVATANMYSYDEELILKEEDIQQYKSHCIQKLYQLGLSLRQNKPLVNGKINDIPSRPVSRRKVKSKSNSANKDAVVKVSVFLPELEYIEFILKSDNTLDLKKYLDVYDKITCTETNEEMVWPVPYDYMPMYIFHRKIEPIGPLTHGLQNL